MSRFLLQLIDSLLLGPETDNPYNRKTLFSCRNRKHYRLLLTYIHSPVVGKVIRFGFSFKYNTNWMGNKYLFPVLYSDHFFSHLILSFSLLLFNLFLQPLIFNICSFYTSMSLALSALSAFPCSIFLTLIFLKPE